MTTQNPSFTILIDPPDCEWAATSTMLLFSLEAYVEVLQKQYFWGIDKDSEVAVKMFRVLQPSLLLIMKQLIACKTEGEVVEDRVGELLCEINNERGAS